MIVLCRSSLLVGLFLCIASVVSAESLWRSEPIPVGTELFSWAPVKVFSSYNPEFPLGGNDGPLWQGKGLNLSLSGGAVGSWGILSAEMRPEFDFSQNPNYPMLNGPGDYGWGLDRVQSYGNGAIVHADWGESEVRVTIEGFRVALGTKALVYGPAQRNHILLSDNAGGFPHLDLGTNGPFLTPWGSFEGRLLWGALSDSTLYDHFGFGGESDWRFFHGLTLGYSPPFWPELTLGAARLFYSPWATITPFKVFESIVDTFWKQDRGALSGGQGHEDDVDQLVALYFDVDEQALGFRLYGEIARNDHAANFRDFMLQPDHTLGYVVGFGKSFPLSPESSWDFRYEQADLGLNYGTVVRPTGSWYRHGPNPAGYTLGGQLLGASIGPGSNGNYLEGGYSWGPNRIFGSFERIANDVDYWIQVLHPADWLAGDILLVSTLGGQTRLGAFSWRCAVSFVKEFNRYWDHNNDRTNGKIETSVIWNP